MEIKRNILRNKKKNVQMQKTTFHVLPIHIYILYKYIHKYILHTTAINLKGEILSKWEGGWGVVVVCL